MKTKVKTKKQITPLTLNVPSDLLKLVENTKIRYETVSKTEQSRHAFILQLVRLGLDQINAVVKA